MPRERRIEPIRTEIEGGTEGNTPPRKRDGNREAEKQRSREAEKQRSRRTRRDVQRQQEGSMPHHDQAYVRYVCFPPALVCECAHHVAKGEQARVDVHL